MARQANPGVSTFKGALSREINKTTICSHLRIVSVQRRERGGEGEREWPILVRALDEGL